MGINQEFEQLEQTIGRLMAQFKIPGASLAILTGDQVTYAKGFGARDLEQNLPATSDTLYGIGSCTKSFTALGIMQLVQEGKLNLEDPVEKYVPFKLKTKEHPITIHNLLSHSSGIPDLGIASILIQRLSLGGSNSITMSSWDDFFRHINGASKEIITKPGEKFRYFNSGYTILGKIIEILSNRSFEDYIRDQILKPLKMERTTFLEEKFKSDSDVMSPSFIGMKSGKPIIIKLNHPYSKFIYPPGGLLSSVKELTNYLSMYFNNGSFEESQLLDKSLLDEMLKNHIEVPSVLKEGKSGYGYGWAIEENFYGHKLLSHSGSTAVSGAHLAFIPEKKLGIAVACNTGDPSVFTIVAQSILLTLLGKDPVKDLPIIQMDQKLNMLTGVYESYRGFSRATISREVGMLYLKIEPFIEWMGEQKIPLIPDDIGNFKFYMMDIIVPGHKIPVEFKVESPQKIDLDLGRTIFHRIKPL
jgi:CubicO group peptidase (beta-lactamase class C family)